MCPRIEAIRMGREIVDNLIGSSQDCILFSVIMKTSECSQALSVQGSLFPLRISVLDQYGGT